MTVTWPMSPMSQRRVIVSRRCGLAVHDEAADERVA
jgi:hypothetical protein